MNNKECKLIQDLLPNYIEKLTSSESNKIIEEHLKECKECQKNHEKMKVDFENKHENNDVEVNYAKKVKANLKILNFILIVIVIAVLVFLGNVVRKYNIFMKMKSFEEEVKKYSNFKMIISSTSTNYLDNSRELSECFIKDDNLKWTKNYNNDNRTYIFYQLGDMEAEGNKYNSLDGKYYEITISSPTPKFTFKLHTISEFFAEDEHSILEYILNSKIKAEEVEGVQCYSIEYDDKDEKIKYYFEKDTGILKKIDNKYAITIYDYKLNDVNDSMFEKPKNLVSLEQQIEEKIPGGEAFSGSSINVDIATK